MTTQPTLFDAGTPVHRPTTKWIRTPGIDGGTCAARWTHAATGFEIIHCGHPTALRPYYAIRPNGQPITHPDGVIRTWQAIVDAKQTVEKIATQPRQQPRQKQLVPGFSQLPKWLRDELRARRKYRLPRLGKLDPTRRKLCHHIITGRPCRNPGIRKVWYPSLRGFVKTRLDPVLAMRTPRPRSD